MRRSVLLVAVSSLMFVSVGCAGYAAPVIPPVGGLFSDYKAPLTTEYDGQTVPSKSGEASAASILALVAWGDCSLEAAAKSGDLRTISYCDYSYLNVLGIYQRFTVIAHGE